MTAPPSSAGERGVPAEREQALMPDELEAKLREWFPWARWTTGRQGAYRCVWAVRKMGQYVEESERVARCRTWENARNEAKAWAWRQIDAARKEAGRVEQ